MTKQKLEFKGSQGDDLSARLDVPKDGKIKAYALFAHCFTCTKDVFGAANVAKALVSEGYAVLRFDFTGLGASEGDFANTNFSSNVQDLINAADFMRKELEAPKLIIGHSLGGAAVIVATPSIPEIRAVVTIGAPADSTHVAQNFSANMDEIMNEGEAEVCFIGRPFTIKRQFIQDLEAQNMKHAIETLKTPLLILHTPIDTVVDIENAAQIFTYAKHPKSFISLDTANHLLSNKKEALYAAHAISGWAERYMNKD
ncbi:MAG: alpha/beta fold hydrolase [Alphaproteobacteria bacterium]|nr:alpha/beta fold hydrolase [Alphaproteobacteria bacterium]